MDNYPIPKIEDLLAILGSGSRFTTINAHKKVYQHYRQPFDVSSAPGILLRVMEKLLQGVPHVVVRI